MTTWKIVLAASLLAGLGAVCIQRQAHAEHDREMDRLRNENSRMQAILSERGQPEKRTSDLVRPDPHNGAAPAREAIPSAETKVRPAPPRSERAWPVRRYFNAGQATPVDALQTMAWACDQGDTATMARLFIIDDEARASANAVFAAIPVDLRKEWNSLESFAASIIVQDGIEQPYPGADVLALAKVEPGLTGRVTLQLPGAIVSGLVFQQTPEGWKYVIREAVVEEYRARLIRPDSK